MKSLHCFVLAASLWLGWASAPAVAQSSVSQHLTLGNPSGATTSTSSPANFLMVKSQYCLSYHRDKGIPNWVSWHLGREDLGSAPRSNTFRADTTLPAGWYRVTTASYTGSGFDRGHMCPSADRTSTTANNSATFIMTNIVPQTADNNQGPWARLEDFCRTLVTQGNELYIISGVEGAQGTIDSGRVSIPDITWKVVVVLPQGTNDLARVTTSTRVIAVEIPNHPGIRNSDWRSFRKTIDTIEAHTRLNLLSLVPTSIQSVIEARVDNL